MFYITRFILSFVYCRRAENLQLTRKLENFERMKEAMYKWLIEKNTPDNVRFELVNDVEMFYVDYDMIGDELKLPRLEYDDH